MESLYVRFLRAIPPSNRPALPLADLVGEEQACLALGFVHALALWGLVRLQNGTIQASSQTAHYALLSLAEWLAADQPIIADWETRGVHFSPLTNGASFLHLLESHRLETLPTPMPTRHERVAQVLIKRSDPKTGAPQILFQYDHNAQRYQLIGGRFSPTRDTTLEDTIQREIAEELDGSLHSPRDYELRLLAADVQTPPILSPTFGALTEYRFHFYHMVNLQRLFTLQPHDRWVNLEEALADDWQPAGEPHLLRLLESRIGNLHQLEDSFGRRG
jgi:hypothetical protein